MHKVRKTSYFYNKKVIVHVHCISRKNGKPRWGGTKMIYILHSQKSHILVEILLDYFLCKFFSFIEKMMFPFPFLIKIVIS